MREFAATKVPRPRNDCFLPVSLMPPYDIEIGCGVGQHTISYAKSHPRRNVIGIERTKEKFRKFKNLFEANSESQSLENMHIVHGDAVDWITHNIQPAQVENYFLLYPNPYPKNKQSNKRFHNMPFTQYMLETLCSGGVLTLATNCDFYADEAKELYMKEWGMDIVEDSILPQEFVPRTLFEKKYLLRGDSCRSLRFRKPD